MNRNIHIAIVGAGLIGSLLAIYLVRRGYKVSVFERRPDPRENNIDAGRSINLALSNRGIRALEDVGIMNRVRSIAIPMNGRMIHNLNNHLAFQPYGKEGQHINSISRGNLNEVLLDEAEKEQVNFYFNSRCQQVDLENTTLHLLNQRGSVIKQEFDYIIGADGAFSVVRGAMQITDRFDYNQFYIEHGYKELTIPPHLGNTLDKNALHIWPRESFMLIALPNPDGSFTCTLFFPFEGNLSFDSLNNNDAVTEFFTSYFPDVIPLLPDLQNEFWTNPTSSLVTIKCYPWRKNKTLLIGDAAHAIVPFYGQGMNSGFEDCRILNELLDKHNDNWDTVMSEFEKSRKPDADAIAQLGLDNFIEMRDLVADEEFLLRKKIEARLHNLYPDKWIPLYSMVTFREDIPYAKAYSIGNLQKKIMDDVMSMPGIADCWENLNFSEIADKLTPLVASV